MEYTPKEMQVLSLMDRTDFKNLSKNDIFSITSKLAELRPDVAREIVAQFPELASLIRNSWHEYRELLSGVMESDDSSLESFYNTLEKAQDEDGDSRRQFYTMAERIQSDFSKCLDNHDLSEEERKEIRENELQIMKILGEKDSEIREHEEYLIRRADEKDAEKRAHNLEIIRIASCALVFGLGIGVSALGGNIKIPKLKM